MSGIQEQALDDAKELVALIEKAGWEVFTVGPVHGVANDTGTMCFASVAVKRIHAIQGA